ncbi:TPA: hypothetical protein UM365_000588 [Stenotrophomonas maltophilia]|nr:hypothetical protein [Stenotrophomonas maltophilia]
MTNNRFPWDKSPVTPEAERLVAQNRAERNLDRLSKLHPMRLRDYLLVVGAVVGLIGIPVLLVSFLF